MISLAKNKKHLRIILFIAVLCIFITSFTGFRQAEASDLNTVRVGLTARFREVTSISINERSIVLGFNNFGNFNSIITVNATSGFTVTIPSGYYARSSVGFLSYAEATMQGAGTILFDGNTYVLLRGPFQTPAEAQGHGELYTPSLQSVLLSADDIPMVIFDTDMFMQIAPAAGADSIGLGDRRYRGVIEFGRFTRRNITAVNVISLEEYLYSVVPSEMPQSWHMEALKAQAVAARSYAVTRAGIHAQEGFDLCDGIHCQAYIGRGNEAERTTDAVRQTAGRFAFFNDEVINATYFSSSGGVTDNSENVWVATVPYLRSVIEIAEVEYRQWQRTFTMAELTQLANSGGYNIGTVQSVTLVHQFNGRVGRLTLNGTNGNRTLQKEGIRTFFSGSPEGSLLSRNFYIEGTSPPRITPGQVAAPDGGSQISILSADGSIISAAPGSISILGAGGNTSIPNEIAVRGRATTVSYGGGQAQGNVTAQTPNLPETTIQSTGDSVTFIGKGNGHGVGMSQFGARGMAEAGFTYRQIIEFYYSGAIVK